MTKNISRSDSDPAATQDPRREQLERWTRQVLARSDLAVSVASADASFRRYFRATGTDLNLAATERQTWIVMDAPPGKEDVRPFIKIAKMLVAAGVNAPHVLAENLHDGFLLLSDLGGRTFLTDLSQGHRVNELYTDALTTLVQMQTRCPSATDSPAPLPFYDAALLRREMELFPEWFLGKHLGITLDDRTHGALESVFALLIDAALAQPQVFVHRDYHSRNLMIAGTPALGPNPGVLDFQDAVFGPITYDLVSLLRDCYVVWPIERVHEWLNEYRALAKQAGLNAGDSPQQLQRWFDLMGIQRHLKVLGIFSRLWHRDGKSGYLADLPPTLNYVRTVASNYSELRELVRLIDEHIAPAMVQA